MSGNREPINFPRSDGDPTHAKWPTQRDFAPGGIDLQGVAPGEWLPVGLEETTSINWRSFIGQAVAEALNMGPGKYILGDWPAHYRFFVKGRLDSTTRYDYYLNGGSQRRFRSRKEFLPHAIWLFGSGADPCPCSVCNKLERKKPQLASGSVISKQSSVSTNTPGPSRLSNVSKPPLPVKKRESLPPEPEHSIIHAEVNSFRPNPVVKHPDDRTPDVYDRLNDIRLVSRKSCPVLHREGELVWCALKEPIKTPVGEEIAFWPGAIKTVSSEPRIESQESDPSSPRPTRQVTTYVVHLLAVARVLSIGEEDVIPYQAYQPGEALVQALKSVISQLTHYPNEGLNQVLDPFSGTGDFEETAQPYMLALEIAANVSSMWCLTDEWAFHYTFPLPRDQLLPKPSRNQLSSISHEDVVTNVLGVAPPPLQVTKQTRFQGLWWGGERIWIEDMVRLKFPRSHLAPQGATNILSPSNTTDAGKQRVQDSEQLVAGSYSRSALLKLEGIMVVDIPQPQKRELKKEIRLCGSLYELADIEYEDPHESLTSRHEPIYPNGQISSPGIVSSFPLPPPFSKFRQIQMEGSEVVMSLTMLSGRYYPRLPNSRMDTMAQGYIRAKDLKLAKFLVALDGTTPGFLNSVDPHEFTLDRKTMFNNAHERATSKLKKLRRKKTPLFLPSDDDEEDMESDSAMDVS